ncbi:class I SAM-dependent methyltransferase [Frigidibacter sp. SD6-1]|uniref:class I SAM-dependent methyltransferase n=1 Tax=Frigidibacter sp. SD6-1 TaxID=3032581 RepID=UPI0024DF8104|nr:class I SAM-dependent methyltransferase [Frigidibacter sp. SD6-1]
MPYSDRAKVYEVEYVEERDFAFVDTLLGAGGLRVLEVPCGAGRLSGRIARKAAELTLVDLEPAMVAKAAVAARASNGSIHIHTEVQNMRTLDLGRSVDLAIIPREALQLLPPSEGMEALAAVSAHLVEGGLLFVDVATFRAGPGPAAADPDYFNASREDDAWGVDWTRDLPDGSRLTRQSAQRQDDASILLRLAYEIKDKLHGVESWRSEMRLYRYDPGWFGPATPDGMTLESVCGDYDGSPVSDLSPRLLAMYRKSNSLS